MTKRLRARAERVRQTASPAALRREAYPAFTAFARGYLHEDFPAVHGTIRDAAAAFAADANSDERRQLVAELELLAHALRVLPMREFRRFITEDLGSRWIPDTHDEFVELLDVIRGTLRA